MKAIVCEGKIKESRKFPKLMISTTSDGLIVLFHKEGYGFVVKECGTRGFDESPEGWVMDTFRDFEGSVTLSND